MEDNKKNIIGIIIGIITIIIILALGIVVYKTLKDEPKVEPEAKVEEAPKVLSGNAKKATGGNSELSSVDISSSSKEKKQMEGYDIIGQIQIPKIELQCNILDEVTKRSIEIAVAKMYTTEGLNQPGNTVIYGHNYRNSLFFSRNDELSKGDKVIITDSEGKSITYEIYDIFETATSDTTFYNRTAEMTGGKAEITLSTCTDDASETDRRLIILAKEV